MWEVDYTREPKNASERECKSKTRHTRQSEGKCEKVHKEKHEKPSVSEQEMEHSKHKHTHKSTITPIRKQQHLNTMNLSDDKFI